jgi:D-3-phosphoglycerate dehydrogenase
MNVVLVTPRSLSSGDDPALRALEDAGFELRFGPAGRTPSEAELLSLVRGCVGWIAGVEPISESVVAAAAPDLKVISRNGVGIDNLPLVACDRLGIIVRKADGANAEGVAELTMGLMLAALRQLAFADAALKRGEWLRRPGLELHGSTIGIVGLGAVGRKVVRMATAFGAKVIGYDPMGAPADLAPGFSLGTLDDLLERASLVTLHCPPRADGQPLLDRAALTRMQDGASVINTARASLVDEEAILAALGSGKLSCYATDVFDREPPGLTSLIASDRVIATPHIGGYTLQSVAQAARLAVSNLLESLGAPHVSSARRA